MKTSLYSIYFNQEIFFVYLQYAALTTPGYAQLPYQTAGTILQTVPLEVGCHDISLPQLLHNSNISTF